MIHFIELGKYCVFTNCRSVATQVLSLSTPFLNSIIFKLRHVWAFLVTQLVKNPPAMWETWVPSPGLGRSPEEGNGYPLQYSGLENSMNRIVHGAARSQT